MPSRSTVFVAAVILAATAGAARAQRRPPSGQVAVVAKLYHDFAWEAVINEPTLQDQALLDQPRSVLRRYFDDRLTSLWLADRARALKLREVGRIDFQPMWGNQDPEARGLRIEQSADSNLVRVTYFRFAPEDSVMIDYHVIRTPRGWRIDDISEGSEWSIRKLLSEKP